MTALIDPEISVVVPAAANHEAFRRCLDSLIETTPPPLEIIVVADGDDPGVRRAAEERGLEVVATPVRAGPAGARNAGAQKATGALIFFIDSDVAVPPDIMSRVAECFRSDPELAAVFGSYDDAPAAANFLSQYRNLLHHYVHQRAREEASTFWAGCGAVRRSVFYALGGFHKAYRRPSIEDIEFGYRLRANGYRVRLCKSLQVKHLKTWRVGGLLRADFFDRAVPWSYLILSQGRMLNDLNLRHASRWSVGLSLVLAASVAAAPWLPLWPLAGGCALGLGALNADLYAFFRRKRGLWFAALVVPWHWLHYFLSAVAFLAVCALWWIRCRLPIGPATVLVAQAAAHLPHGKDGR